VTYIGHGLNSSSVELVYKFVVQPKFVEIETELVLADIDLVVSARNACVIWSIFVLLCVW